MTQFEDPPPYIADYAYEPPRRSSLAITALVMSILGIIPCCGLLTAPLGVVLGIIGVVRIGSQPHLKGRGMAFSAIVIGLIASLAWFSVVYWGYENFTKVQAEGPREAFVAGFAGDATGFREEFFGDAAAVSDEEVEAFIAELRSRYGEYVGMHRDDVAFHANPPTLEEMLQPIQAFPYRIEFADATVDATIESAAVDPSSQEFFWRTKFGSIVIHDPDRGDLEFPPQTPSQP